MFNILNIQDAALFLSKFVILTNSCMLKVIFPSSQFRRSCDGFDLTYRCQLFSDVTPQ